METAREQATTVFVNQHGTLRITTSTHHAPPSKERKLAGSRSSGAEALALEA